MKLAIASTTLLFAMMAAQAAVLSTTSSTGVNLVKRAPTSDDEADVEQSDMAGQSSSDQAPQLPLSKHEKEKFDMLYGELSGEFNESVDLILDINDEIEALKDSIGELKREREGKTPFELTELNASIAEFEKELAELEYRFREMMTKREPQANVYRELKKAWSLKWAKQIWTNVGWTGTVEHESMGTRHDNRALAARLADFLQVAYRQYQSTLWEYHRDRLVEVG
ncbi:hypothetical protein BASA60_008432 [Batrachochytrium salamandrivorans]|nr:hypothetical protein BASA60_008432 [Batrachochytrium salamandrivorans]